jgi:SET and MYND domain-containing protein
MTPYGGRGLFAVESIPKDTLLITCDPHASVIYRKFRKEVCGHCFAYAFDSHRNYWNVRLDGQTSNGVWFCKGECRDAWVSEQDIEGLQGLMNAAIDKQAKCIKKPNVDPPPLFFEQMPPQDITLEVHDLAWKTVEATWAHSNAATPYLDEMELDMARFVVSGIIQRYFEDKMHPKSTLSWSALLELQNNELLHIRSRPSMLDSHLRIYGFLRKAIITTLQDYVKTSETIRAILSRDQGNVFGLWDMSTKGDSEMLGWAMYISGSYFNHSQSRLLFHSCLRLAHPRKLES